MIADASSAAHVAPFGQPAARLRGLWGGAITERSGFVAVPMSLLKLQSKLGLDPVDLGVLVNLLGYRWTSEAGVFPRNSIISKRMGVSERTVQRSTQKMIKLGLIARSLDDEGRRVLKLDPLVAQVAKLTPSTEWRADALNDDV